MFSIDDVDDNQIEYSHSLFVGLNPPATARVSVDINFTARRLLTRADHGYTLVIPLETGENTLMSTCDDRFAETEPAESVFAEKRVLDPLASPDEIRGIPRNGNSKPS